jgi:hypothetical protein
MLIDPEAADTAFQFVANYFGNVGERVEYSNLSPGPCWNGYVSVVAGVGMLLEEVFESVMAERPDDEIESWYCILDDAVDVLIADFIEHNEAEPDHERLRPQLRAAVYRHLVAS